MIEVGATAKIDLRGVPIVIKQQIMSMYTYKKAHDKENDPPFLNYDYKDRILTVPPCKKKLAIIAELLGKKLSRMSTKWGASPFELQNSFELRPHQPIPAEEFIDDAIANQFTTLEAGCGTGKSWVMSYAAGHLGHKVLILIDQGNLIGNFEDAFKAIWNKEVQQITAKTTTFSDVCICTFQLLAHPDNDLLDRIGSEFGTCLVDEAHTIKAATFKHVLSRLHNKYRLACSATFYLKGLPTAVLEDWLAPVAVTMVDEKALSCDVYSIDTGVHWVSDQPMDFGSIVLPQLAADPIRNIRVMKAISRGLELGRKILVICISKEQVQQFHGLVDLQGYKSRTYIGSTSKKADKALKDDFENGDLDIVFTIKKAEKGLDIPILDMVILAKPNNNRKDTDQITGRTRRSRDGKPTPMVIDFKDSGTLAEAFHRNRMGFYFDLKFNIKA